MFRDSSGAELRQDWTLDEALAIHDQPFMDLVFAAHGVHRTYFDLNSVQMSRLLSIKTGGCPEDYSYCGQSARNGATLPAAKLMAVESVIAEARKARAAGATRYCMDAAWREPKDRDMAVIEAMVRGVRAQAWKPPWRAVDREGQVIESRVAKTRDKRAALKFQRLKFQRKAIKKSMAQRPWSSPLKPDHSGGADHVPIVAPVISRGTSVSFQLIRCLRRSGGG